MKKLVEDTFHITAKEAANALPKNTETGEVSFEIAGQHVQEIVIVSTASNLEGLVRWFICPACRNRVGKLYLPSGEDVFLCRKCHDLGYRAQQLRAFKKPDRADAKPRREKPTEDDWMKRFLAYIEKIQSKQKTARS